MDLAQELLDVAQVLTVASFAREAGDEARANELEALAARMIGHAAEAHEEAPVTKRCPVMAVPARQRRSVAIEVRV